MSDNILSMRRRLTSLPLLTAAGAVIFIFEAMIPAPLPWVKLGLSNVVVVLALYRFGLLEALTVSLLRILVGGLFTGSLFSPAFLFSVSGGLTSVLAMWILLRIGKNKFSPVGISLTGAVFHSFGQLTAARYLFIQHPGIWNLLPLMVTTSVITGTFIGFMALIIMERIPGNAK